MDQLGIVILVALAVISVRQLVVADSITRAPRYFFWRKLTHAGGWLPVQILTLIGCVSCLPFWLGVLWYAFRDEQWMTAIVIVFAIRYVAQTIANFFGDGDNRDLPDGLLFPPTPDEAPPA